jgi:hypothetical protein
MMWLFGCEESQACTVAFRKRGIEAFSCDLKPCSGAHPEWHLQMDVFEAIESRTWDGAVFFPDCTYLTCSAEWAYKDPDFVRYPGVGYHQKLKPGTLFGEDRRKAREKAQQFFMSLWYCGVKRKAIENPVGVMSSFFRPPDQILQPHYFGDDASKKTCIWKDNLPMLKHTKYVNPRIVNGKERWANQTDSGQNKLSPSDDRAELRSKTYPGIADAFTQWI